MSHDERGRFEADIPDAAIAEALAAVERRRSAPEVEVEVPEAGASSALDAARAERDAALGKAADEHARLLRTAADLDNYKKRAARERDEVQRYGVERLAKDLLPALDALDRALAAAPPGDPLASGVELTRRLLEEALGRAGVKGFSAVGERFDPRVHEALMSIASPEHAPGMVVHEQHRGFMLHDRLLRPAAVVVSAAPPPAAAGEEG